MATRAERVKEALDHVHGHEKVAFALAINDRPLRRAYFNQICGYDESVVVKTLAKLANNDLVAETDGLEFQVASKEVAKEIREHLPPELAQELHSATLDWAEGREELDDRFLVDHLIGACEFSLAAEKAMELRRLEDDPFKAKTWLKPMRQALEGLLAAENKDINQCVTLGLSVAKDGYAFMQPKMLTSIFANLLELDVTGEQREEIASCEAWIKGERARKRAAAKSEAKAQQAAQQQNLPETSDVTVQETTS